MLKLAKLLHSFGFHITFVHTEHSYAKIAGEGSHLTAVDGFEFATISDGLPPEHSRGVLDLPLLAVTAPVHGLTSFRKLLRKTVDDSEVPPISCIISDGLMTFTLKAAEEFNIPLLFFFTSSACGFLGFLKFEELIDRGIFPLKDESYLTNGYLDSTTVDWTPSIKTLALSHLPTFIRTTNPDDIMFNYNVESNRIAIKTGSIILNTFEELEHDVLDEIRKIIPEVYTVGPLHLLYGQSPRDPKLDLIGSSLWREDEEALEWLDRHAPKSVVYINYGSLLIMTPNQLSEFAWGLADSKHPFLWVIRPDLVHGGPQVISKDFLDEIKDRGLLVDWCPQERVLNHSSIGGFLTHCGWNSTLESIVEGVPTLCWPFFADQQINCLYSRSEWGIGMEIDANVDRKEVEKLVRELMEGGEKGKKMKEKVMEWKFKAEEATKPGGSSHTAFASLVQRLKPNPNGVDGR
ncbi:hypothetical protein M569_06263 [Genlisea aurea]|uniref:Glycosyltransferase n=1 Tax=Genlisea aurea TaxID=192259 RepID=S8CMV7_9LAMI|nr:hypothetical protein M569_06263 [Genlisea aurea]